MNDAHPLAPPPGHSWRARRRSSAPPPGDATSKAIQPATRFAQRHDGVRRVAPWAATDHQDPHRPRCGRRSAPPRRHGADIAAHPDCDEARLHVASEAARKAFQHLARQVREAAVGEAGDGVFAQNDQRPAREPCGEAAGPVTKASQADHDPPVGSAGTGRNAWRGEDEAKGRDQPGEHALAAQPADDSRSIGMPSAGMTRDSSPRACEPEQLQRLLTQQARQRQRREYVSPVPPAMMRIGRLMSRPAPWRNRAVRAAPRDTRATRAPPTRARRSGLERAVAHQRQRQPLGRQHAMLTPMLMKAWMPTHRPKPAEAGLGT